jgi:site-specific recombinase XerD
LGLAQVLPVEAAAKVRAYHRASKVDGTVRAYRTDTGLFTTWCAQHGLRSLPDDPAAVAGFLVAEAERGIAASTIGRRVAAIAYAHKRAEQPDPTDHPDVTETLKGIRRRLGTARAGKAPATAEVVTRMLAHIPAGLAGQRDRTILALGFSAALRRSELVGLMSPTS